MCGAAGWWWGGARVMAINCAVLSVLFGADWAGVQGAAGGNLLPYFRWAGNGFRARVHASHYREEREGCPGRMARTKQLTWMLNTSRVAAALLQIISAISCVHIHALPDCVP